MKFKKVPRGTHGHRLRGQYERTRGRGGKEKSEVKVGGLSEISRLGKKDEPAKYPRRALVLENGLLKKNKERGGAKGGSEKFQTGGKSARERGEVGGKRSKQKPSRLGTLRDRLPEEKKIEEDVQREDAWNKY